MDARADHPYLQPMTSFRSRMARAAWGFVYVVFFRFSPRPLHAWRSTLLRLFGASLGRQCRIYPKSRIWAPWNLRCDEGASVADEAIIYNVAEVHLGYYAIVSQQAYVCTATHDFEDPAFRIVSSPIRLGQYAWVCARANVLPGVTIHDGAVLGLGAVATGDLEAWQVYAGNPAKRVRERRRRSIDTTLPSAP